MRRREVQALLVPQSRRKLDMVNHVHVWWKDNLDFITLRQSERLAEQDQNLELWPSILGRFPRETALPEGKLNTYGELAFWDQPHPDYATWKQAEKLPPPHLQCGFIS